MAASDAKPFPQRAAIQRYTFPIFDATGALITGGTTTVTISKDQGAFGNPNAGATTATEIATASGVWYVELDATDHTCDTLVIKAVNSGGTAKPTVLVIYPQTAGDANLFADDVLARDIGSGSNAGTLNERTVRSALRLLRNKSDVSAGTLTARKEDDSTSAWTAAVTTNAGANPIVSIDPA
jgi:hypothetical protein